MSKTEKPKVDGKTRWQRVLTRTLIIVGCIGVTISALMVTGVLVPFLPIISAMGSMFLTGNVHSFIVSTTVSLLLLYIALRRGAGSKTKKFFWAGVYAIVGSFLLLGVQMTYAYQNGVTPNPFVGFISGTNDKPDETVPYTTADGQSLTMDVYRPADGKTNAPIAMYIHGGGWTAADSTSQAANLRWLSQQGYLAFGVNTTLAAEGHPTWNTAVPQLQCSFGWVKQNAAKYGGDASRFALFGESSGGQLALTSSYAIAAGKTSSSCGGEMPKISAVVAYSAPVDMKSFYNNSDPMLGGLAKQFLGAYIGGSPDQYPDRVKAVEPASYLTKDAPATLMFINKDDRLVPYEAAKKFVESAKNSGTNVKTVESVWQDHASAVQYYSIPNQVFKQLMLEHFKANGV
jgi:acetyl esterase/lipase